MDKWRIVWITAIISGLLASTATLLYFGNTSDPFPVGRYQISSADGFEKGAYWLVDTKTGKAKIWRRVEADDTKEKYAWVDASSGLENHFGTWVSEKDIEFWALRPAEMSRFWQAATDAGNKTAAANFARIQQVLNAIKQERFNTSQQRSMRIRQLLATANGFANN